MNAPVAPVPTIEKGYYRLTKDIANPKPDRRSKRFDSREVWPKGTLVKAVGPDEGRVGTVTFADGSYVMYGGTAARRDDQRAGDEIVRHLEAAPDTLGIVLKDAGPDATDILAFLLDAGKLTLDEVKAALTGIDALDPPPDDPHLQSDEGYTALRKRHGLVVFGAD